MKLKNIKVTSRTVVEKGVLLPWERWSYPAVFKDGKNLTPDRPHPPVLLDSGSVFVPLDTLYELSEQDVFDSQFGSAFLLHGDVGPALEQAGLAAQETRGGYHRTEKLLTLIERLENQ
jgi:hypothetical protein